MPVRLEDEGFWQEPHNKIPGAETLPPLKFDFTVTKELIKSATWLLISEKSSLEVKAAAAKFLIRMFEGK